MWRYDDSRVIKLGPRNIARKIMFLVSPRSPSRSVEEKSGGLKLVGEGPKP